MWRKELFGKHCAVCVAPAKRAWARYEYERPTFVLLCKRCYSRPYELTRNVKDRSKRHKFCAVCAAPFTPQGRGRRTTCGQACFLKLLQQAGARRWPAQDLSGYCRGCESFYAKERFKDKACSRACARIIKGRKAGQTHRARAQAARSARDEAAAQKVAPQNESHSAAQ